MASRARYEHNQAGWAAALGEDWMLREMYRKGEKVQVHAEMIANRDTGQYAGDIDVQPGGFHLFAHLERGRARAVVYNPTPWAKFLERGTRYMKRYRPLGRALDALKE